MGKHWIEKREGWIKPARKQEAGVQRRLEARVYSVADAARFLNVDKRTVMKWLKFDEDDPCGAIIPPAAWFKLPNGIIRIEEWALLKIKNN